MKNSKPFLVLAIALFMAGCASEGVVKMTGVGVPPKPPNCKYEIFGAVEDVKKDYEVTCILDAKTGTTVFHKHSIQAALDHLHEHICACGGDAIIVVAADKDGALSDWGAGWGKGKVKVKVIRYTEKGEEK